MRRRVPPLGQHFLHDPGILRKIAACLPLAGRRVIEIGPGEGALTRHLLAAGARVTAIEIDPLLAARLPERVPSRDGLEILRADILDVDLSTLIRERNEGRALVAGNLPYYITAPILRKIFDAAPEIEQAVLLMQKEVAQRVVAVQGSRDYGFLSGLCRLYCEPVLRFTVPPGAFRPPPQVTSAVVHLKLRNGPQPDPEFVEFLKLCFAQPRKKLLNNLSGRYDRVFLAEFKQTQQRAQQMSVQELLSLWKAIETRSRLGLGLSGEDT
jgi:16S rRNA (adenine1518-N6/adenine1519-N6)-dimethyltransferase